MNTKYEITFNELTFAPEIIINDKRISCELVEDLSVVKEDLCLEILNAEFDEETAKEIFELITNFYGKLD